MNQQNTVESRVLSILKDCPRARFDDMILIMPLCDLSQSRRTASQ